jgi:hypothetical protein
MPFLSMRSLAYRQSYRHTVLAAFVLAMLLAPARA